MMRKRSVAFDVVKNILGQDQEMTGDAWFKQDANSGFLGENHLCGPPLNFDFHPSWHKVPFSSCVQHAKLFL